MVKLANLWAGRPAVGVSQSSDYLQNFPEIIFSFFCHKENPKPTKNTLNKRDAKTFLPEEYLFELYN